MKKIFSFSGFFFTIFLLQAQYYQVDVLTEKDGLMSSDVRAVFQDEYGVICVGNGLGITKLYGDHSENIKSELSAMWAYGFYYDIQYIDGAYWFNSYKLKGEEISRIKTEKGALRIIQKGDTLKSIGGTSMDSQGYFWTYTDSVNVNDKNRVLRYKENDTLDLTQKLKDQGIAFNNFYDYGLRSYFKKSSTPSIICSLYNFIPDNEGGIWIRSKEHKLFKYNESDASFSDLNIQVENAQSIYFDSQKRMWISVLAGAKENPGIYLYENSKRAHIEVDGTYKIAEAPNKDIWLINAEGLFKFENQAFVLKVKESALTDIKIGSDGKVFVLKEGEVKNSILRLKNDKLYEVCESEAKVFNFFVDRENIVWVPTEKGLIKCTPSSYFYYNQSDLFNNAKVKYSLDGPLYYRHTNSNGIKFYSSWYDGLFIKKENGFEQIVDQPLLNTSHFVEDSQGNFYVAKEKKGYLFYESRFDGILKIDPEGNVSELKDDLIKTLVDKNENALFQLYLWNDKLNLVTHQGVYCQEEKGFTFYPAEVEAYTKTTFHHAFNVPFQLFRGYLPLEEGEIGDNFGNGKHETFVFDFDKKEYSLLKENFGDKDFDPRLCIGHQSWGYLFMSSYFMMFKKDGKTKSIAIPRSSLTNEEEAYNQLTINFLDFSYTLIDSDGVIYYYSYLKGLVKFDPIKESFTQFTIKDGLSSNMLSDIAFSPDSNYIWLSSKFGLQRIKKSSLNEDRNLEIYSFDRSSGIEMGGKLEFPNDTTLLMYSSNGHTEMKIGNETASTAANVFFTDVKLLYESVNWDEFECELASDELYSIPNEIQLDYDQNTLTFNFQGVSQMSKISYEYKLEGLNDETHPTDYKSVSFTNLKPGDYTFYITAFDANGNESETKSIHFNIAKPYWQKAWFLILSIILIIILLYLFIKWRTNSLKKKQEELENEVEKATKEIGDQKEEISQQHEELKKTHQEITDSIAYAKRIQTAILPPSRIVKEYLKESFILYKPKDVVAGDFYWMDQHNDTILFAAADCTGHGVPGAMVSVVCNNALNRAVREYKLDDPGKILDKTRDIVVREFEKSNEEVKDGMDIALCSIHENELKYAGANNPLWLIRKGEIIEIKSNRQPIGKFKKPLPFTTHSIELEKGDTFYLFTDGYVDQFGGKMGKKLKSREFRNMLVDLQELSMSEQKKKLDESFEKWRGNLEQVDDVCIIGVRIE